MKKIMCVGGITTDILVKPADSVPPPGVLRSVDSIVTQVGGCASNCATDLARLGIPAAISCRLGQDNYGDFVKSTLAESGIDVSGAVQTGSAPTTVSIVCIHSDGERSFLYNPGSTADFCKEDIDMSLIDDCDIVFVAGAMLMNGFDGPPTAQFLQECRKRGKYTVMDTAWDFDDVWLPKIEAALEGLDLFMPSYDEAVKLSGQKEPEQIADFFAQKGVKDVVIKLGADGAYLQTRAGLKAYYPTYREIKPVDTTGAGDSFCAGFLAGLSMDWPPEECARFANAVGTHCIMKVGASAGIPSMNEVLRFMREHDA